jgi:hypothetical protein
VLLGARYANVILGTVLILWQKKKKVYSTVLGGLWALTPIECPLVAQPRLPGPAQVPNRAVIVCGPVPGLPARVASIMYRRLRTYARAFPSKNKRWQDVYSFI